MMIVDDLYLGVRLCLGLAVVFLSQVSASDARPPGDCSSIFFGSLSDSNAAYITRTGVYHSLDGVTHNDRRVYKHTNGLFYMYSLRTRRSDERFWAVGPEVGSDEAEMIISADDDDNNHTPEVTSQQKWRMRSNENESWSTVAYLKAVCVDEEFGPCTSGRLRMSGISSRNGMQKRRMGLYALTNRTHNLRPVYKHEKQSEFLFYTTQAGGQWIVGPQVGKISGGMFVPDFALRPEFILQTWVLLAGRYFVNDPGVTLKCQGVDKNGKGNNGNGGEVDETPEINSINYGEPHVSDTRPIPVKRVRGYPLWNDGEAGVRSNAEVADCDSICLNGGHCQRTDPDVYRCICPEHYFGLRCQIDVDCGRTPLVGGQQVVSTTGHHFLDVAFYRCPANTILDGPAGVICQVDGTWTDPPKCLDGHHLISPMHE